MSDANYWKSEIAAAARAQNAFMWILLALGVFYLALGNPALDLPQAKPIPAPFISVDLPPLAVWATAPAVLFFVLLAFNGALRAADHAVTESAKIDPTARHPLAPNALDYVIRTTPASHPLLRELLSFAYVGYITLFVVEASSIALDVAAVTATGLVRVPGRAVLLPVALVEGAVVWLQTYLFWRVRLRKAVALWRGRLTQWRERRRQRRAPADDQGSAGEGHR